jgi:uncharacterized protein YdeI (YjbR/CyaY-like superfamily)
MPDDYPTLLFETKREFAKWLARHHAAERGVWLRLARAASELKSINHDQALDVALCYGWIDGQAKSYDSDSWVQKFTPRGKRSVWSKRNQENVKRLIASGDMRPAGLAAIEAARADGSGSAPTIRPVMRLFRKISKPSSIATGKQRSSSKRSRQTIVTPSCIAFRLP